MKPLYLTIILLIGCSTETPYDNYVIYDNDFIIYDDTCDNNVCCESRNRFLGIWDMYPSKVINDDCQNTLIGIDENPRKTIVNEDGTYYQLESNDIADDVAVSSFGNWFQSSDCQVCFFENASSTESQCFEYKFSENFMILNSEYHISDDNYGCYEIINVFYSEINVNGISGKILGDFGKPLSNVGISIEYDVPENYITDLSSRITGRANTYQISIMDICANIIKTNQIVFDNDFDLPIHYFFDGLDDLGQSLSDGIYIIELLRINDPLGNKIEIEIYYESKGFDNVSYSTDSITDLNGNFNITLPCLSFGFKIDEIYTIPHKFKISIYDSENRYISTTSRMWGFEPLYGIDVGIITP